MNRLQTTVLSAWQRRGVLAWMLAPLAAIFCAFVYLRRLMYRQRFFCAYHPGVPVVVVGNITVGGSGKTPLTIWLARHLQARGWHPVVITRGYGRKGRGTLRADADSDPHLAGDEPVLIAATAGCPVVVDAKRARAARVAVAECGADIVLTDDGLQHYALARDIEIAVSDGARGLGNGWCLPAGPLREPAQRLKSVEFRLVQAPHAPAPAFHFYLRPSAFVGVDGRGEELPLTAFRGQRAHAVAGIGHPPRFFATLQALGIECHPHAFADHHVFNASDMAFDDAMPIVMTAKDAVKCRAFARPHWWYLRTEVVVDPCFIAAFDARLAQLPGASRPEAPR